METTSNTKQRGRPKTPVVWPDGEFTAEQAFAENSSKISRVSIHNKINEELESGSLVRIKKVKAKIGRPSFLYQFVNSPSSPVEESAEELNF